MWFIEKEKRGGGDLDLKKRLRNKGYMAKGEEKSSEKQDILVYTYM